MQKVLLQKDEHPLKVGITHQGSGAAKVEYPVQAGILDLGRDMRLNFILVNVRVEHSPSLQPAHVFAEELSHELQAASCQLQVRLFLIDPKGVWAVLLAIDEKVAK